MISKLEELKTNKKIASFYLDENNTDKFLLGYVIDYNDDQFIVAAISREGRYDGFVLKHIKNIFRINTDGKYENKILALAKYHKAIHEDITLHEKDLIIELMKFAEIKNYIVSIELLDSGFYDIQGYVEVVKDDSLTIKQITEYGEEDGVSFVSFYDITQVSCNSSDEIILKILNSINYK